MTFEDEIILYCDSRLDKLSICSCLKETPEIRESLIKIRNEIEFLNKLKNYVKKNNLERKVEK